MASQATGRLLGSRLIASTAFSRSSTSAQRSRTRSGGPHHHQPGGGERSYHDFVRAFTADGTPYKVSLDSRKVLGIASSRGWRDHQEDRTRCTTLELDPREMALTHQLNHDIEWDPGQPQTQPTATVASSSTDASGSSATDRKAQARQQVKGQLSMFSIYDGHGGSACSDFLAHEMPDMIEGVKKEEINEVVDFTKALGGYFRRFRGGGLSRWVNGDGGNGRTGERMSIEERVTLAFLKADKILLSQEETKRCGSTASMAFIHSLDEPGRPYFSAEKLSLIVAHLGDTSILLCRQHDGRVESLTERHHADSRVEAARLRRLGAGTITDSFGESRWMGVLENTRAFGDGEFKPLGVTAEPDVRHRIVDGRDYCYMVLVTDGISTLISNQEIIDLARNAHDPYRAARTIVDFAEDLGAQDNCTCIVVPLAGWGRVGGRDETEERREYRRKKAGELNTRMQRM